MFNIDNFLIKFKNLTNKDKIIKDIFSKIVLNILNIKINNKDIYIKKDILYIKTSSINKNEIFLNKSLLIKEVKKKLKNKDINNII